MTGEYCNETCEICKQRKCYGVPNHKFKQHVCFECSVSEEHLICAICGNKGTGINQNCCDTITCDECSCNCNKSTCELRCKEMIRLINETLEFLEDDTFDFIVKESLEHAKSWLENAKDRLKKLEDKENETTTKDN